MSLLLIIATLCILFQAERGIFGTLSFLRLFKKIQSEKPLEKENTPQIQNLYILIPVLREQSSIEDTLLHLLEQENDHFNTKAVVITTIRERLNNPSENPLLTSSVISASLENRKLKPFREKILLIEENEPDGNMATQLNFAVDFLSSIAKPRDIYLLYNADSIASPQTFSSLGEILTKTTEHIVFQQPCAYVKDIHRDAPSFLNALSIYQSWYCLGHESSLIRRYEEYSQKTEGGHTISRLGVIVGHGSGMTFETNTRNGGYPTDLLTEDLTFGFILSARNTPIISLPALELADVPEKFIDFIRQKSVWFWNYLGYASCYQKMLSEGISQKKLIPLFLQGIGGGAYWFFSGVFILLPIFLGITLDSAKLLLIAIASPLLFSILPQYILFEMLPGVLRHQKLEQYANHMETVSFWKTTPWILLVALTDSVGPWIASFQYLKSLFTGKLPKKYKTGD